MLFAFLLLVQSSLSPAQWSRGAADVHAYRTAAERIAAGDDPYMPVQGRRIMQYLYPPTFALLFAPVLRADGQRGLALWSALQLPLLGLIVLCVFAVARRAGARSGAVALLTGLLLYAPAWRNGIEGQVNAIWVAALFAGVLLAERRSLWAAGLLLALAAHIKVLPVVVVLVLVAQRRPRVAAFTCAAGLLLVPLAGLWATVTGNLGGGFGATWDLWLSWFRNMVQPVATDSGSWVTAEYLPWNHSFVAALHRLFDPELATASGLSGPIVALPRTLLRVVAWTAAGGGAALGLVLAHRGRRDPVVRTAAFGLVVLMANLAHAQTWTHHLLSLALLVPLISAESPEQARGARYLSWTAVAVFALLFTVPSALVLLLPPTSGAEVYGLLFPAGARAFPTLSILFVWLACFRLAWLRVRVEPIG